jgi:hypothetical protein
MIVAYFLRSSRVNVAVQPSSGMGKRHLAAADLRRNRSALPAGGANGHPPAQGLECYARFRWIYRCVLQSRRIEGKLDTGGDGLRSAPLPPDIGGSLNDSA